MTRAVSGRAGQKGSAYTLITTKDKDFAGHLVRNLEGAGQQVPDQLMEQAMQVRCRRLRTAPSGGTLSADVRVTVVDIATEE